MLYISEKDLYNYVMHPENLEAEKTNYIQRNLSQFIEPIAFLIDFNANLKKEVPPEIIDKIKNKIMNSIIKVELNPVYKENNSEYIKYAANSQNIISSDKFYTFRDDNKDHLIKVNSTSYQTKIFLFSSKLSEGNNISLIFKPSGSKYKIDISEQPLIVDRINSIDSIELSFTN